MAIGVNSSLEDHDHDLPLDTVVEFGLLDAGGLLLYYGADVNAHNMQGESAMVVRAKMTALSGEKSSPVFGRSVSMGTQFLLETKADVAATDCDLNRTSLEWAVIQGNEGLVWLLLQHERFNVA